jgi:hypothetical protein
MSTKHKVISESLENSALNIVSNNRDGLNSGKGKRNSKFYCNYCRRDGHSNERCWVLHPHLRPNRSKSQEANFCAPADNTSEADLKIADGNSTMEIRLNNLTQQVQALLQTQRGTSGLEIVNAVKVNGNRLNFNTQFKFVIDSGASDNMVYSDTGLIQVDKNCAYPHILVANGQKVPTKCKGKFNLFQKETDAIVVPDLKSNLLSVSKCTNN